MPKKGEEGNNGEEGVTKEEFEKLQKSLAGLANLPKAMEQIGQGMKGLGDQMKVLSDLAVASVDDKKKTTKTNVTSEALEDMNNAQLVDHIVERMTSELLPVISEKIDGLDQKTTRSDLKGQVEKMQGDHEDFWQWQQEMTAIAKVHPDLPINRLYELARAENPDKVVEIDKKAEETKKAAEKEEGSKEPPFGGLTPTSGVTIPDGEAAKTIKEAAESAWDTAMADVPAHMLEGST